MTKREHVLQLLREAGPRGVTTAEFLKAGCGSRFGARIQELRDAGYVIDSKRVRSSSHVYTLRRCPESRAPAPPDVGAVEPLQLFEASPPAPANALCWDEAA